MDNEYAGVYSNIPSLVPKNASDDWGLDVVSPLFFHPFWEWKFSGPFVTALNFDFESYDRDLFYFCQIYSGMSARIKLLDAEGNLLNPLEDTPALPEDYYATIEPFDAECGTVNLTNFSDPTKLDTCPDFFVCHNQDDEGIAVEASDEGMATNYSKCVEATNCHTMASMTTTAEFGKSALFCHQMIPLHQNAIHMAKALMKTHDVGCYPEWSEGHIPWECELEPLLYDIINVLAHQNQELRFILEILNAD